MKPVILASLICATPLCADLHAAAPQSLEFRGGERIALIGNSLADRLQHEGTLEALIYKSFPQQDLSFRNLAWAADELTRQPRTDGFANTEAWLTRLKTDVVLAFFGFNESFGGNEGVAKFKADLGKFLKETQGKNYGGKGPARVVLFSPIAQEKLADPNFADPAVNNANIKAYTEAMREVAAANEVQFVDLFSISNELYAAAVRPLTFNGIHLTEAGYRVFAPAIYKAVFGKAAPAEDGGLEKLRMAVEAKNETWFQRFRTVDSFNIWGGRGLLPYAQGTAKDAPKKTNNDVLEPEMTVRDVMTANREQRVWALAKGSDLKVDDSNVPAIPAVITNKPGDLPDGSHTFLSGQEAISKMTVPKNVKVELFADEKQFPELVNPVQMAWDTKGRLWISAWKNYPERTPSSKDGDKLLILEDTDGDGKADKCTTFLDDLNCPTGFQFFKDGVLVMKSPDLWYVRDTDGDGKADWKERVLGGLSAADSHHETNSMALEPGGAVYLSDGVFHRTQVETPFGPVRNTDGSIYRYEPRTAKFERYAAFGFANPHGRVFDYWGNDIITDATGNVNYFGPAFSGFLDSGKHPGMKAFWDRPSRPCPGTAFLSSRAWPDDFNGNFLNCNVISIQGVFRVKVSEEGSGLKGETLEHLITSTDPNFRPSGISVGPDGALYLMDWSNAIIGHLQHHLRDPNRDHQHGRIYRLTYEGRPLLTPAKIYGQPIEKLLDLLKEPENNVRERAKTELGKADSALVAAAVDQWVAKLDKSDRQYEHHLTEALWVKQSHNLVDLALLKRQLRSPDFHARFAATRVLCYQRDRVPDAVALLKIQAADENPRVRLEAVRAASFFRGDDVAGAIEVAQTILKQPTDYYLDYTLKETLRQLHSLSKETTLPTDPQILGALVSRMSDDELKHAAGGEQVWAARVRRKSTDAMSREAAIVALAKLHNTTAVAEIVKTLAEIEAKGAGAPADELGKILLAKTPKEIVASRAALIKLVAKGSHPLVRRVSWAALTLADNNALATWKEAADKGDLLEAIRLLPDPSLRAQFQPVILAGLADKSLSGNARASALKALPLMGADSAPANFPVLAAAIVEGSQRTAASRAIMQLPRTSWQKTAAAPVAESILSWAKSVPARDRAGQDFVETVQAGMEMASLLPEADSARIRKELRGLGVSVFVVKTVREEMRYDTAQLVVEAGKPFEVIFENLDQMAHNLVLVTPGSRMAVAEAVQTKKPDELDKEGRAYVPQKDARVLGASKLIEPGDKQTLKLSAPANEGEYEYVCTFPGHAIIMWGKLIVTKDVDAYLQSHPATAAK